MASLSIINHFAAEIERQATENVTEVSEFLKIAFSEINRLEALIAEKDEEINEMISEQDYKDFYGQDVFKSRD